MIKEIQPYIEKKLVSVQEHPEAPWLKIYNYTHQCQYEKAWDYITVHCRGLIIDSRTDQVIARPFPKFFNMEEHLEKGEPVPDEMPIITEKYDGSLGILYWLNGQPYIATRGSFTSEQAKWATEWFRKNIIETGQPIRFFADWTYLFEIIYPENRIVVNYDFSGLVFLGALETETGKQILHAGEFFENTPIKVVEQIHNTDWKSLHALADANKEGFVINFPESKLRLKVKFEEYVRLHKILTGLSAKGVWEYLKEHGIDADIMEIAKDAPDEFYDWLREVAADIVGAYQMIEEKAQADYMSIKKPDQERKEFALLAEKTLYPNLMYAILDNDKERFAEIIFKLCKPKKESYVFKQDIDQ